MRTILPIIAALALACSGAVVDEAAEQAQAVCGSTCLVSATNQTVSLPSASTHLCAPTRFECSGGHSAGPILAWGIPAFGGFLGGDATAVSAFPNYGGQGWTGPGTCRADVQCDEWSKFHGTGAYGTSSNWNLGPWSYQGGPPVSASGSVVLPWWSDIACYVSHVWGLSIVTEKAELTNPNGQNWQLDASGWRSLGASARCANVGRPITSWQYLTATPGSPAFSGMSAAAGRCFITSVEGNLDDGQVKLTGNPIVLYAFGGVTRVKAQCTTY